MARLKLGFLGYGSLGKFLVDELSSQINCKAFDIVFIWNRSAIAFSETKNNPNLSQSKVIHGLANLESIKDIPVDLVIEVCHPSIIVSHGAFILQFANLFVGSPTSFSDPDVNKILRNTVMQTGKSIFIPSGALWGGEDIQRMADNNKIARLRIAMTKHPASFKLTGELETKLKNFKFTKDSMKCTLFDGSVKDLCPLAPNNVNTMAAAAICAHTLGFEKVEGSLIADLALENWHNITVEVWGFPDKVSGDAFYTKTVRKNPAQPGKVTGSATYHSFLSSVKSAAFSGKPPGVYIC